VALVSELQAQKKSSNDVAIDNFAA